MACNLDGWLALSVRVRWLCWLITTLCGLALVWWLWVSPLHHRYALLERQQLERDEAQQAQWRKLRMLAKAREAPPLPESRPFSPLDFQAPGRQLVRWQPAAGGGEMALETRWDAALAVFPLLAERDLQVPTFSLTASESGLRLELKLEHDNGR